jgi:hypothetical protein
MSVEEECASIFGEDHFVQEGLDGIERFLDPETPKIEGVALGSYALWTSAFFSFGRWFGGIFALALDLCRRVSDSGTNHAHSLSTNLHLDFVTLCRHDDASLIELNELYAVARCQ